MNFRLTSLNNRAFPRIVALLAVGVSLLAVRDSRAEERRFLIIKASMPRSFTDTDGTPPIPMPSIAEFEQVYFLIDPDNEIGSFAEYWAEVSYNIVNVVGRALGTVELPWPQYPVQDNTQTTTGMVDSGTIETNFSPASDSEGYIDLNEVSDFQFGSGERVREDRVLIKTDIFNTANTEDDLDGFEPPGMFDNQAASFSEDVDGDGRLDLGNEDLDQDGHFDLIFEDFNFNCQLDANVSEDCRCGNCDGIWVPPGEDCNGNGFEDFVNEDLDFDGGLDTGEILCVFSDRNCNGKRDVAAGEPAEPDDFFPCAYFDAECQILVLPDPDNPPAFNIEQMLPDGTFVEVQIGVTVDCLNGDKFEHSEEMIGKEVDNGDGTFTFGPYGDVDRTEDLDQDGRFETFTEDADLNGVLSIIEHTPISFALYDPKWTPGERFRDVDGDTHYDALFEPAVGGFLEFDRDEDGIINNFSDTNIDMTDRGDYNDRNDDGNRDFPEPMEDFMVMRTGNEVGEPQFAPIGTNLGGTGVIPINCPPGQACPSPNQQRYVLNNYPGNVPLLLARTGNKKYDSPDDFVDQDGANRKLEIDTLEPTVPGHSTPEPSWYLKFWEARYGFTSAAELPAWQINTPNLVPYTPPADSTLDTDEINFHADIGGTSGWGTVLEQMLHFTNVRTLWANIPGQPINCVDMLDKTDIETFGEICPCDPTDVDCLSANSTVCVPDGTPDACPPSLFDPEEQESWFRMFNYDTTPFLITFDEGDTDEDSRIEIPLLNDVIYDLSSDGMTGCIEINSTSIQRAEQCDIDGDGVVDNTSLEDLNLDGIAHPGERDFNGDGIADLLFEAKVGPPPDFEILVDEQFAGATKPVLVENLGGGNCNCIDFSFSAFDNLPLGNPNGIPDVLFCDRDVRLKTCGSGVGPCPPSCDPGNPLLCVQTTCNVDPPANNCTVPDCISNPGGAGFVCEGTGAPLLSHSCDIPVDGIFFDGRADTGSVNETGGANVAILPPLPPDFQARSQPGSMVDLDNDGFPNDWLFALAILEGQPLGPPFLSFAGTIPTCNCVDFDVADDDADGIPDNNWCWDDNPLAPGLLIENDALNVTCDPPFNAFKPECESPYYPVPILTPDFTSADEAPCTISFAKRHGDGGMPEGVQGLPGGSDDDPILPAPTVVYDGPKEYDDLASSIYHTKWISASGFADAEGAVLADYGGDQALGEVTTSSPDVADRNNYGHDKASHFAALGLTFQPDGLIVAAGPLAGGFEIWDENGDELDEPLIVVVHGGPGADGGNILNLEVLTWRRDGTAPSEPLAGHSGTFKHFDSGGFRDFNLDGMLDLGEGRDFGTDNYAIDSINFTTNDGMQRAAYPFNRDRLLEDVIEALDPSEDFDIWRNNFSKACGGSAGDINHMILLPIGLPSTSPFAVFSPGLTSVVTLDAMPGASNSPLDLTELLNGTYSYTNLAASLDRNGETEADVDAGGLLLAAFAAHEFGHFWECWPDLYSYNIIDGFQFGHPIGRWDLMSGSGSGLVHVNPVFKKDSGWIRPTDLRTILTPGVEQKVVLGAIEFAPDRYFFYENHNEDDNPLEGRDQRFYFHHLEDQGEFSSLLPWDFQRGGGLLPGQQCPNESGGSFKNGGVMVLHTDLASNIEGIPPQQRFDGHFSYLYLQGDGLHNLEATSGSGTSNVGDAGDPYPGFCNNREFNASTDPNSRWWSGEISGIQIIDVVQEIGGSTVTFLWTPQAIPTLVFKQPPGGVSVGNFYTLLYTWDDVGAGSGLTLFRQSDNPADDLDIDDIGACQGDCYGGVTISTQLQKAAPGARSESFPASIAGLPDGTYRFYGFLNADAFPGVDGVNSESLFSSPAPSASNQGVGTLEVIINKASVSDPDSIRLEGWTLTYVGGNQWEVCGSLSGLQNLDGMHVKCADADEFTGQKHLLTVGQSGYTTTHPPGAVSLRLTGSNFEVNPPDTFSFATTGFTPYSAPIVVENGHVEARPIAVINVDVSSGFPPLTVNFDGSESVDSEGDPDGIAMYQWDFEDDGVDDFSSSNPTVSHTFVEAGEFVVRLTVRDGPPNFRTGSSTQPILVTNSAPIAVLEADPTSGDSPLTVNLDASGSFDPDGDDPSPGAAGLMYEWDFNAKGDVGGVDPRQFGPTSNPRITRTFPDGTWTVAVDVIDADGFRSISPAEVRINSGNQEPIADFTITPGSPSAGTMVVFDASASSDPDGDPLTYNWSFGDGSADEFGKVVTHVYTAAGNRTIDLKVTDGRGGEAVSSKTIVVAPGSLSDITASITADQDSGRSPLDVELIAVASSLSGSELSYRWEFNDDSAPAFGRSVVHRFINDGEQTKSFTVVLVVTDENGTQATATKKISVCPESFSDAECQEGDPNLIASFELVAGSKSSGDAPLRVEFTTAGSGSLDGLPVTCRINFGDSNIRTTLPGVIIPHVYDRAGTFEALSTTIGATGSEKNSAPITIVVTSSGAPIAQLSAGPSSGLAPLTVQFTGTVTDPEGDPLTFSWDFGDGSGLQASVVPSISHTFEDPGQFEVTLTAADDQGDISTVSVTINVLSADDGGGGNGNGGLPDANANDNGAGQEEPDEPICGCGAVGSMQFMMILIGIFGLKYSRRRRG